MPNGFIILAVKFVFVSSGWCPYVRISDDIITDEWVGEWVTRNGIVSCVFAFCEIITIITTSSDMILLSLCPSRWSWMTWHVRTRDEWECFHSFEVHLWIHLQIIVKAIILRILYYLGQWSPISITCFYPSFSLSLGECGGVDIIFCDSWNYLIKSQSHSIRAALLVNWTLPKCLAAQIFNVHQSCLLLPLLLLVNVLRNNNNNNYWALN